MLRSVRIVASACVSALCGCAPDAIELSPQWQVGRALTIEFGQRASDEVSLIIEVSEDAIGFGLIVVADETDAVVVVQDLVSPSGDAVISSFFEAGYATMKARRGSSHALEPRTGAALVEGGPWAARIVAPEEPTDFEIAVWIRRDVAPVAADELRLVLHVAPELSLEAAIAQAEGALALMRVVGRVSASHESAAFSVDASANMTNRGAFPEVHVFVAPDPEDDESPLGFSPIPGCPVGGTTNSTLRVALGDDPFANALTLAHELGHFFGLDHTSDLFHPDRIEDTPDCDFGTLRSSPHSCPDAGNIMFPYPLDDQTTAAFTPEQTFVLTSTLLFPAEDE